MIFRDKKPFLSGEVWKQWNFKEFRRTYFNPHNPLNQLKNTFCLSNSSLNKHSIFLNLFLFTHLLSNSRFEKEYICWNYHRMIIWIYTTIWIDRCNLRLAISSITPKPYILQKFLFQWMFWLIKWDQKKLASNLEKKWGHFLVLHIKNLGSG